MKNHNPVGWFEIYVDNMERAKEFYQSVFQTKLENYTSPEATDEGQVEMWGFSGNRSYSGAAGALCKMADIPAGQTSVLIYFTCEDCAVEEKRVVEFGGKVEKPKHSIGEHGFISLVFDTEDNLFGLHSMK